MTAWRQRLRWIFAVLGALLLLVVAAVGWAWWQMRGSLPPLEGDEWELYDTRSDFSLSNNVADQHPDRLKQLKDLFDRDAGSAGVS